MTTCGVKIPRNLVMMKNKRTDVSMDDDSVPPAYIHQLSPQYIAEQGNNTAILLRAPQINGLWMSLIVLGVYEGCWF